MKLLTIFKEKLMKIKDLVKNNEWQVLRKSLEGTWSKSPQSSCLKLRDYLDNMKDEKKLRIVMNYLTGTGFRTGKIKHKCITKLRKDISLSLKSLKESKTFLDKKLEIIQESSN